MVTEESSISISEAQIETKFKQIKNLVSNRGKSDSELRQMARKNLEAKLVRKAEEALLPQAPKVIPPPKPELLGKDINIAAKFKSQAEKRQAVDLLEKYLTDYEIQTISDKNTIQEVIYLEVLQLRLQEKLNELHSGEVKALPYDIIGIIHKNSEVIIKLKSTLGLNKAKAEKLEAFTELDLLKKRFKVWREDNQASRTIKCPHCVKFVFLKMRTQAWEAQAHPYFKDNMIYNKHLFAHLGQTVLIDNNFIAGVLETSKDYIDWVTARVSPVSSLPVAKDPNAHLAIENNMVEGVVNEQNQEVPPPDTTNITVETNETQSPQAGSQFDSSTTERPG